jgi:peroxiredoxin
MTVIVFGVALPWLLVVGGALVVLKLIGQNGRILLKLEAMEQRLTGLTRAAAPAPLAAQGLAVGTEAPAFELPGVSGGRQSLAQFRGRRTLLIFFNPQCGFCKRMLPDLATLPVDGAGGRPVPLVVTTGDQALNRRLAREHKVRAPVLLQEGMTIAAKYQVQGTPMGYLLDERGRIASPVTVGADALLALARSEPAPAGGGCGCGKEPVPRGNRPLSTSKLVRDGLKAGTPAPSFRAPLVGGGELAVDDYRGRRVLLVFSDPQCGPCMQLAPRLEQRHCDVPGVAVLMVSRRGLDENRRKIEELGLSFPVAVQNHWDISKLYGMFATPIAYLIDEQGVIAAEVAVGIDAILALLERAGDGVVAGSGAGRNGAPVGSAAR